MYAPLFWEASVVMNYITLYCQKQEIIQILTHFRHSWAGRACLFFLMTPYPAFFFAACDTIFQDRVTAFFYQLFRISSLLNLPESILTHRIVLGFFRIFYFDDDPNIFLLNFNKDIAVAISGFSVRFYIPSIFVSKNSQQDSMIKFSLVDFRTNVSRILTVFCHVCFKLRHDLFQKNITDFHIGNFQKVGFSLRFSGIGQISGHK